MLAAIVRASNRYAMRPALVIDDRTYTYQELFGLAGSICETLRNLKEDIIGITAENRMETYASILAVLLFRKTIRHVASRLFRQNATWPDSPATAIGPVALQWRERRLYFLLTSGAGTRVCVSFTPANLAFRAVVTYVVNPDVPAYIIFPSGSTGEPKRAFLYPRRN